MKKIIYRTFLSLVILLLILVFYLSTVGVKTDKFNSRIISQINQIEPKIELKLKDVSATFDPLNFEIKAKTLGTDLIYRNKIIKIETVKSNISLKSFFKNEFALTGISISTKSLAINDLISFIRLLNNDPKFFIAEQLIENGYVVADLKFEFDESGNIRNNYEFKGLIKDGQISFFKKYNLNKIDFFFEIDEQNFRFNDIKFSLNKKDITIPNLIASKLNDEYLISGKLITQNIGLTKNDINNLIDDGFFGLDVDEVLFNSNNDFNFKLSKNFKIKNLDIKSDINLENLKINNTLKIKDIFPKIKKEIIIKKHKIKLEYQKNNLSINGNGEVFLQNEIDTINYEIKKNKNKVKFNTTLNISKNSFNLDLLNYKKKEDSKLKLKFKGVKEIKKKLILDEISLKEKKNIISVKNLILSNNNKIDEVTNIDINFIDKDDLKNNLQIKKNDKIYSISGDSFNIDKIIERLLNSKDKKKSNFFNKNIKLVFDIQNIYLDKNNSINNLKGIINFNKNQISELNLESKFSNFESIKFTINNNGKEEITTLYSHKAKPLVDRYKFIKGFEEGDLDFYSIKRNGKSNSTLKIDNFKIQEIPVLAKLLTLASLQGIADLLTGEGIRFSDFEMKFSSNNKLMTIEEMYAIGPAISILMEGYIEKNNLISLRGTLVPATTINRTISSIPVIGNILVGKKVGEGVFGVSFKIKGPPKDLETTVNPIKTLTPRFITRTLEKIKKN